MNITQNESDKALTGAYLASSQVSRGYYLIDRVLDTSHAVLVIKDDHAWAMLPFSALTQERINRAMSFVQSGYSKFAIQF